MVSMGDAKRVNVVSGAAYPLNVVKTVSREELAAQDITWRWSFD